MVLVFVSHASRDKELVEALKALFTNTGLLVKEEELFVSSIDGCDVDDGEDFLVEIRTKLREATLAIPIITPAYLDSEFCHWELGAIWASDAMWFPLRLGIETDQLPTLIKTRQVKELGRGPLNGIRKRVQRLEEGRAVRDDLWRAECTSLLNEVPDIVTSLQGGWNTTSRNLERIEARVGQASGLLREAMYSIREAGWTALTVKAGEPSKAFRLSLRHVAKEIKRLFVHTTGKQIRVSIKQLVYEEGPPDGEGPAIRLGAQELARDDPNHVRGATDLVDDNTALCHIVKGEEEYFFSNRLSALRGYKNSH
ncbi:MAG: toll/interleukin-1 receptor domain-containing protein, partial [Micrococcales bacterium]|nr:toll/interleukin-1 receptor domain-containing protein [Micrococcales bacterium]